MWGVDALLRHTVFVGLTADKPATEVRREATNPWRTMPHHGMTPHISGTSLSAQARYAAGTREILECWFEKRPIRNEYLIVDGGKLAGAGAHSYSAGDATKGSEDAAKFKRAD